MQEPSRPYEFDKEIVKAYFSGEIKEVSKDIITKEYIQAIKDGDSCKAAMNTVADVIGCSKRTVRRTIYGG